MSVSLWVSGQDSDIWLTVSSSFLVQVGRAAEALTYLQLREMALNFFGLCIPKQFSLEVQDL